VAANLYIDTNVRIDEVDEIEELLGDVQMGTFLEANICNPLLLRVQRLTITNIEPILVDYGMMVMYKLNVLVSAQVVCNIVVSKCEVEPTGSCVLESKFKPKIILF
jgi:hypothetical protein